VDAFIFWLFLSEYKGPDCVCFLTEYKCCVFMSSMDHILWRNL